MDRNDFSLDYNQNNNVGDIVSILKEYGVCVIDNYPLPDNLNNEIEEAFNEIGSPYPFGDNLRMEKNTYSKYKSIDRYFNNNFFKSILDGYTKNYRMFNESIFATKDYKFDGELGRNGWLHFDRLRCFKFFVYISDVTIKDGPFSVVPKTHIKGGELRQKSWGEKSNYDVVKNRIELDYADIFNENEIIPIVGKRGTLSIFDTDIFHKGGQTNGGKRTIIRSHTYI
jgi:hypothetical protein